MIIIHHICHHLELRSCLCLCKLFSNGFHAHLGHPQEFPGSIFSPIPLLNVFLPQLDKVRSFSCVTGVVSRMRWFFLYVGFALGCLVVDIILSHLPALIQLFASDHDLFSNSCWKKEGKVQTSISPSAPLPHLLHHFRASAQSSVKRS